MKQRSILIGFPSGNAKLVLFEGTEDETTAKIYGINSSQPYAKLCGINYPLTDDEISTLRRMIELTK